MQFTQTTSIFTALLMLLVVSNTERCGQLGEKCSRFYKDQLPCCWPNKCQQVDEYTGKCVTCIKTDEFCVDSSECCSKSCHLYLCT
ncbi:hypothetical protein CRM22_005127 [Opisthorchis felineus]|uniref:UPF0506 domain-containing protein n=1 Tax=Opisthorchis felineus TaxID=147828 RepID=A0A4S2LZL3_OPIFE|nr:hypothetical protein CRM22_005127 [Opisthorchis felineus]